MQFKCSMCLDSGFLPKALILPEPPDIKCPNGCKPKMKAMWDVNSELIKQANKDQDEIESLRQQVKKQAELIEKLKNALDENRYCASTAKSLHKYNEALSAYEQWKEKK